MGLGKGLEEKLNCLILLTSYMMYNCLGFFSDSPFLSDHCPKGELATMAVLAVLALALGSRSAKSLFYWLAAYSVLVYLSDDLFSWVNPYYVAVENTILFTVGIKQIYKKYDYQNDEIDRRYIHLLFRKADNFKEYMVSLKADACSFGMLIGNLFQFKRNKSTMQEIKCKDLYLYEHYHVINTGILISVITKEDIKLLLEQKARQIETLFLRVNCLRSFRHILNKLDGYGYKGDFFPSNYLERIYRQR